MSRRTNIMSDKLKEEGFEIVKCGPQLRSLRIVDYKKFLFDFEKEAFVIFDED